MARRQWGPTTERRCATAPLGARWARTWKAGEVSGQGVLSRAAERRAWLGCVASLVPPARGLQYCGMPSTAGLRVCRGSRCRAEHPRPREPPPSALPGATGSSLMQGAAQLPPAAARPEAAPSTPSTRSSGSRCRSTRRLWAPREAGALAGAAWPRRVSQPLRRPSGTPPASQRRSCQRARPWLLGPARWPLAASLLLAVSPRSRWQTSARGPGPTPPPRAACSRTARRARWCQTEMLLLTPQRARPQPSHDRPCVRLAPAAPARQAHAVPRHACRRTLR